MKRYIQPGLFVLNGDKGPHDLAAQFGIADPLAIEGPADGSATTLWISEGSDDHELVMRGLTDWLREHQADINAIHAKTRGIILKHFISRNHGSSYVMIPEALSVVVAECGLRICVNNVTIWEDRPANRLLGD